MLVPDGTQDVVRFLGGVAAGRGWGLSPAATDKRGEEEPRSEQGLDGRALLITDVQARRRLLLLPRGRMTDGHDLPSSARTGRKLFDPRAGIERPGIGESRALPDWAQARAGRNQAENLRILTLLMELAGLYALMALVNSVAGTAAGPPMSAARLWPRPLRWRTFPGRSS
ncbi:hypothetical protein [Lentzea albidocapillata]|uniref:hypothetical protein n=1 Tax=Lentzea albidocapillata TaxID=40571 RepID=UPI0004C30F05|nr:hypothetical protein [Lentzea albidocapillata]